MSHRARVREVAGGEESGNCGCRMPRLADLDLIGTIGEEEDVPEEPESDSGGEEVRRVE